MTEKFTICFDTICEGFSAVMTEIDGEAKPLEYDTEKEAQAEIDSDPEYYEDCFVTTVSEIGHKSIWRPQP